MRRSMSKVGEGNMARKGVSACAVGLVLLALLPKFVETRPSLGMRLLQAAAVCMAFTSATVVNALTAFASLQCDEGSTDPVTGKPVEEHPQLAKGTALGKFRSSGQLGRALGPLLGEWATTSLHNLRHISHLLSMRILLDVWTIAYIWGLRCSHDCSIDEDEANSEDQVYMTVAPISCGVTLFIR